jgi:hypothetical protein
LQYPPERFNERVPANYIRQPNRTTGVCFHTSILLYVFSIVCQDHLMSGWTSW